MVNTGEKMKFKKEYVIYHKMIGERTWFFDEPYPSKKDMASRLEFLNNNMAEIKIRTRYTLEI
jgi:hypothetical protein